MQSHRPNRTGRIEQTAGPTSSARPGTNYPEHDSTESLKLRYQNSQLTYLDMVVDYFSSQPNWAGYQASTKQRSGSRCCLVR